MMQMPFGEEQHRSDKEKGHPRHVGELSSLVDLSSLDLKESHAVDDIHGRLTAIPESDDVDLIASLCESLCIAADAVVVLIKGIGHHTNPHLDSLRGRHPADGI